MKKINNLNQLRTYLNEWVHNEDIEMLKKRGDKCFADSDYRYLHGNGLLDCDVTYKEYLQILDEEIEKYEEDEAWY